MKPIQQTFLFLILLAGTISICSTAIAKGVDPAAQRITISLTGEPPTLDSSLSEDSASSFVLGTIQEGLVSTDLRGKIIPGLAESWTLNDRGGVFHLRENARWSDGKPVTAHDFVYAFRRLVDPTTGASGSTFFSFAFENATEIIKGEKDKTTFGARALDDRTLEITTSRRIPYLLRILSATNYSPLREDFVVGEGSSYAADHDKMLFTGPYILDSWVHGASLSFSRNPYYWNKSEVSLNGIDAAYITSDKRALLNLYHAKELSTLTLDATVLDDAIENGYRIRKTPNHCSVIITLNHRPERPTSNKNLRKALQHAFDPSIYANRIISLPGTTPSYSAFTSNLKAEGKPFTERFPIKVALPNIELAKQYMQQARAELNGSPKLVLLSREGNEKKDEYLQALFKDTLGLEVKIDRQSFKQSIERLINGEFDLAVSGFCNGNMDDPFMAATTFTSKHPFNDGKFKNARYDELFEFSNNTSDERARMQAFSDMQDILIEEAVIIPTYESSDIYVQDKAVQRLRYGAAWNFSWARIRQ